MYLREQLLSQQLKKIKFISKRKIFSDLIGEYKSIYKGSGLEFHEIKEYQYGDNIKDIDWNITARFNKPYIKKYLEDRNRNIYFVLDVSSSILLNDKISQNFLIAAEIFSLLLYSALVNGDNVSLVLFSDGIKKIIKNRRGVEQYTKLFLHFVNYENIKNEKTNLAKTFLMLSKIIKKKSIIFIISDFIDGNYEKEFVLLSKKNEVVPVVIDNSLNFPKNYYGIVEFTDAETGEIISVDICKADKIKDYQNLHFEKINNLLKSKKVIPLSLDSTENIANKLIKYFKVLKNNK